MHISNRPIWRACSTVRFAGKSAVAMLWIAAALIVAGPARAATLAPHIGKAFGASSIPIGGTTSLTLAITNANPSTSLTGIAFTDTLPSGLVFASPCNLSSTCAGVTIASLGTNTLSLSGGALAAEGTCSISVNVMAVSAGTITNSVTVTSTNGGTGNTAEDTLVVPAPPTIAKKFGIASIHLNGSTSLTFTITNVNSSTALTGMTFTDILPSGLVVSSPENLTSTCGGTAVAMPGTDIVSLSDGALIAKDTCFVSIDVTAISTGKKTNAVTVTSTNAGTGITAGAELFVTPSNTHDFNADGESDLVWRDTGGNVAVWLMNGAAASTSAAIGNVPTTWNIVGQRDFNGDGKADLLWLDTSGNIAMWFMNGRPSARPRSSAPSPPIGRSPASPISTATASATSSGATWPAITPYGS
jgi:uncharacterized repeat protein (TIGR01451 family)